MISDMSKKLLIILIVNIFLLLICYFSLEIIIKKFPAKIPKISFLEPVTPLNTVVDLSEYETEEVPDYFQVLDSTEERYNEFCGGARITFGEKYNDKIPLIVFGCSYSYGHGLKIDKTFPYVLSEITKRPVYNYSICGVQALYCYNAFELDFMINLDRGEKIKDLDYFIYVYMWDHINRYMEVDFWQQYYIRLHNPSLLDRILSKFYVFHYINMKYKIKQIMDEFPNSEKSCIYLKNIMLYIYGKIKEKSPNAKLIILIYDEKIASDWYDANKIKYSSDVMKSHIWKELEEETNGGIKVVHTKEITGFVFDKDWKLNGDISEWHPNEKVWSYLTPLFVKEYIK